MSEILEKRQFGAYYTEQNPFEMSPFKQWARLANLNDCTILEPFAGINNIVHMLQNSHNCTKFACYDIAVNSGQKSSNGKDDVLIKCQDTLKSFPNEYDVCISNPPWLARNSARRRGLEFDIPSKYDDMYKYALHLALENCNYVAFIVPATFIRTCLFRDRLHSFILLEKTLFADTDNPVCLALFTPNTKHTSVWVNNASLGRLDDLENRYNLIQTSATSYQKHIRFNSHHGTLGLRGVDNTKEASIRFCHASELAHRTTKHTDRAISKIALVGVTVDTQMIDGLNQLLTQFRNETHDIFLAPFKGLRDDGKYRRRLDYSTARGLVVKYLLNNPCRNNVLQM